MIGTNAAGTAALANHVGVGIEGPGNTVGGTTAGAGNLISGNSVDGLQLDSIGYGTNNLIAGNRIGTNAVGTGAVPNAVNGVNLEYGGDGNTIGGTVAGAGNLISGNGGVGVLIGGPNRVGGVVEGNQIGTDLSGAYAVPNGIGVELFAGDNTIGGTIGAAANLISGNTRCGIEFYWSWSLSNLVEGNKIGTNITGAAALGNGEGILAEEFALANTIGGTAAGAGNLISGNATNGVEFDNSSGNVVEGNGIGLDPSGTSTLANLGSGILIDDGSTQDTIGGPVSGVRNVISGNATGIVITDSASGTLVAGNLIGTDSSGTLTLGNFGTGISVANASDTMIGGATTLARNLISGNGADGIDVVAGSTGTMIGGNYIGTDQTGTLALGNAGFGLSIDSAPGTTIGGTAQGAGNVISGNMLSGLSITGVSGASVEGNLIGTDKAGTRALGNALYGIITSDPSGVVIGGTGAGARNIISGNAVAGVGLIAGAAGSLVQGNLVGTDITGSSALGNGTGIVIESGSANNTIGGTAAGAGNTIAYSAGIGVDVDATAGIGNAVRLNSIFSNGGLGIDLGGDGVTLNDSVPHVGPNDHQNFPVITASVHSGGATTVTGTLSGTPSTSFTLDFYTLSSMNASGYGEGRYVLGSAQATTSAAGTASFSFAFNNPPQGAQFVTVSATSPGGNTSEFSQAFGTNHPPVAVLGFTSRTVNLGQAIYFDGTGSHDPDGDSLTDSWSFGDGGTAMGANPIHTYRQPGTFTVMLTVHDGFGAANAVQATIIVNNVAPSFVPGTYAPPLAVVTPASGDGYGEAVASVNEAIAVGARFGTDPGDIPAGLVYLYDANPDDTGGLISTHTYGDLLHVFADPNPAAGDLFGASVAAVGNNLLIGAPGSALTGPGDGAAYLFDANPDSPTFGDLLATFSVPNSDPAHEAAFGTSVSSAGTNVVIGAPGKAAGIGEAYVFGGDPTLVTFGSLLLDIANPTLQAGRTLRGRGVGTRRRRAGGRPRRQYRGARRRSRLPV